jgi:hypothetical protein
MPNKPIKLTVTLVLDIVPGTYDEEQIRADVITNLEGDASQLGSGYGPERYQVNNVTVLPTGLSGVVEQLLLLARAKTCF